ncbi:MAG TPA: fatty acyl-AMP ligase [Thermomonospora sp.]|nr:fatty acyl-AMP ligase [Thermomonospora sp.]
MAWPDGDPGDETVVDALARRAKADGETAIRLESLGAPAVAIGCAELLDRAREAAGGLADLGVGHGDRVVLVLPTGADFPAVFYGVLLAGAVAVPIYPPASSAQMAEFPATLRRILRLTGGRTVVTLDVFADALAGDADLAARVRVVTPDRLKGGPPGDGLPVPGPDDLALIQFSSGSSGDPKGICLTHRNLTHNIRAFQRRMEITPGRDVVVSWLPLYHDMGLIGTMIGSLVTEIPLVLASPLDFLRDPVFWLRLVAKYRATISVAPQFAFSLCVRRARPERLDGLDLSSLRVLLNGAEPVQASGVRAFEETFGPYGLGEGVVTPCYGLAEHALAVAMARYGEGLRVRPVPGGDTIDGKEAVSVGPPVPGTEVAVRDRDGAPLPDETVGRIVVRSASVGRGVLTEDGMAPLADEDGWLNTGDLGFLADGELYVVGREKDLILTAGRNIHPQDLEQIAATVEGVRTGRVIAFGVEDAALGTQAVVVAAETRLRAAEDLARCATEVRHRVAAGAGVVPRDVVLLPVGAIPLTSSGKLRRSRLKESYVSGDLGGPLYSTRGGGAAARRAEAE